VSDLRNRLSTHIKTYTTGFFPDGKSPWNTYDGDEIMDLLLNNIEYEIEIALEKETVEITKFLDEELADSDRVVEKFRTALEKIIKHQKIVGGSLAERSTVVLIAERALRSVT